jgi:hypothetical protein
MSKPKYVLHCTQVGVNYFDGSLLRNGKQVAFVSGERIPMRRIVKGLTALFEAEKAGRDAVFEELNKKDEEARETEVASGGDGPVPKVSKARRARAEKVAR